MKLNTTELREAFKVVDNVPVSPVLESSQFIRMKQEGDKLTLSLTGSLWAEASVTGQGQGGKWTCYIDRRLVKAFMDTASDPDTEIFYKDKLTMKSGQRLEQALHAPISGYEKWEPKTTFDLTDDQMGMLKTAVKYLPNTAGTENVETVCFSNDYILVTDSLQIMAMLGSSVKTNFFMPPDVARFLAGTSSKIAVDKNGVGAALTGGFVYQPRSASLDTFPADKLKEWLNEGVKTPTLLTVKAQDFLDALRIASQFIFDKNEAVTTEPKDKSLLMTVGTGTGQFQRSVPITGKSTMSQTVKLSAKRIIPWLEYAVSIEAECKIDYCKLPKASVFRFTDNKRKNLLLCGDL